MNLLAKVLSPTSSNKEKARREFILNILLTGSLLLSVGAFLVNIVDPILYKQSYSGENYLVTGSISLFLLFLFYLSKTGKGTSAALILTSTFLFLAGYVSSKWGTEVPVVLLIHALTIVMSGILVGTRFAFGVTFFSALSIGFFAYLEINHIFNPDYRWKSEALHAGDTVVYILSLCLIASISWLSNREIEKALHRMLRSEKELKKQRDLLEIKVEERTNQLKQAQAEKMMQLYRFAEFGKSATGLFHDLANPLMLISLNLSKLQEKSISNKLQALLPNAKVLLDRALLGTKRLEGFVRAARSQLQKHESISLFYPQVEIAQICKFFEFKANKAHVKLVYPNKTTLNTYGNILKFNQVFTNLISNAIDSFEKSQKTKKIVYITLKNRHKVVEITVSDNGMGIQRADLPHVFKPFFTTKSSDNGTGLGLSIAKEIVEKDLHGTVHVTSKWGVGSAFKIKFPIQNMP